MSSKKSFSGMMTMSRRGVAANEYCEKCGEVTPHYMTMSDCGEFETGLACTVCAMDRLLDLYEELFSKLPED